MARKTSTREFKLKVVRAVEAAELRPAQARREYQIAESFLNRWRHEVRLRGEDAFTPLDTPSATTDYEGRIAERERVCGQLAMENAALKKHCSVSSPNPARAYEYLAAGILQLVDPPTLWAAGHQPLVGLCSATHAHAGAARCGVVRCDRADCAGVPGLRLSARN